MTYRRRGAAEPLAFLTRLLGQEHLKEDTVLSLKVMLWPNAHYPCVSRGGSRNHLGRIPLLQLYV